MGLQVGELFVDLGIKGTEKTIGALSSVKKGLAETESNALAVKAGILGALYGFERMMALSGQTGTSLTNFTASTGLSAKQLQQYQYAARQAGVSNEELTGSFKAVQQSMSNILMGKQAPEGLNLVASTLEKMGDRFDFSRMRDTAYVWQQLQKAAQALPPDLGKQIIASFGVSEGNFAAMRRNMFRADLFARAPTYSDRETQQLDKANIAWSNLGNKIQMAFGHFNALHGVQLVNDISKITDHILKMVGAFQSLADKLKVFVIIGKVFDGWGLIFQTVTNGVDSLAKMMGGKEGGILDKKGNLREDPLTMLNNWISKKQDEYFNTLTPQIPAPVGVNAGQGNVVVNQNIVHHGNAKDTAAVKDLHRYSVEQAYRIRPSQRQGS